MGSINDVEDDLPRAVDGLRGRASTGARGPWCRARGRFRFSDPVPARDRPRAPGGRDGAIVLLSFSLSRTAGYQEYYLVPLVPESRR